MKTIIQAWGNSSAVRLPKWALEQSGFKQGESMKISAKENIITLEKDPEQEVTLKSLFKNYKGEYEPEEISWGDPQGKEVW